MSVEVINEVAPANHTIQLNCTLLWDANITWYYNDKMIDHSNDANYEVKHENLTVKVGKLLSSTCMYALLTALLSLRRASAAYVTKH